MKVELISVPDINGWLSEYEFDYLNLYKEYHANILTDAQLIELSEMAKLLYPQVYKKLFEEEVGTNNNEVMIKSAYNIAMTGGKKAGYLVYTMRGYRVEYMRYEALRYLEGTVRHHREIKYRNFEVVNLDGLLRNGYHYNQGLKVRRLSGKEKHIYRVYGDSQSVEK